MLFRSAWISLQRPISFLRALAAILAGIVVLRIGYERRIVGSVVGTTPIFNWLLWGYGVPALSFWGASHFLRRSPRGARRLRVQLARDGRGRQPCRRRASLRRRRRRGPRRCGRQRRLRAAGLVRDGCM